MEREIIEIAMPKSHYKKVIAAQELVLKYEDEISSVIDPEDWEKILDAFE